MKKFTVWGTIVIGAYTEVEAESEEAAIEIAEGRGVKHLCHRCDGSNNGESKRMWCFSNAGDAEVEKISANEQE